MKYSSTTRLINTFLFALLAAGFGTLGILFGILYTPFLWRQSTTPVSLGVEGWGLSAMLGVLGLTGFLVSLYGLYVSGRSIAKGNDDSLVKRSFGCYIGLGYVIALFFLANATWLYRLTSSNLGFDDITFVVIVFIVAFLVAAIVSNIPLIRLYGENEELNKIMKVITGPLSAFTCAGTLVFGLSYFVLLGTSDIYGKEKASMELSIGFVIFLVAFVLSFLAFIGYGRADKANVIKKANGLAFEGSLFVLGGGMVGAGAIEYVFQSVRNAEAVSLVSKSVPLANSNYLDFAVTSWIFGGILVIASLVFCASTLRGSKKKAE